jgi:hypothetical protein
VIGLIKATAEAWGGNPDKEAKYLNVFPPNNDAKTVYRLMVKDVPVDGFWSISGSSWPLKITFSVCWMLRRWRC